MIAPPSPMFGVAERSIVSLNKWITDRSDFLVCFSTLFAYGATLCNIYDD